MNFTGALSGLGRLAFQLANAHLPSASRTVSGTAGSKDRALLTVSRTTVAGEVILEGGAADMSFAAGLTGNLVVTNRGGAPTTAIAAAKPLASPFIWGASSSAGFPAGTGAGRAYSDSSVTLPFAGRFSLPALNA